MSKPPKIVIPGLNRGSGIPGGYVLGRRRGTKQGPAELLNLTQVRAIGIATTTDVTTSTSLVQSIAHSETISLSRSVSTSLSALSGSVSGAVSSVTSLSTAVSTVISGSISSVNSAISSLSTAGGPGQSTSLSQISSSLSGAISSTSSLSTAVSTVDANQSTSLSSDLSKITSLSTVVSGSISSANSRIDSLSTVGVTLTGDVTGSGSGSLVTTIGANKVTLPMLTTISANTFLGNVGNSLSLGFVSGMYSVNGVDYGSLAAVPGYSYTRTGTVAVLDSDNSIDSFVADSPPINGYGYHAYAAATNLTLRSKDLDLDPPWGHNACAVTADAAVAPDGTTTADLVYTTVTAGNAHPFQSMTYSNIPYTQSVFAKAAGKSWFKIGIQSTGGGAAWFNLATGVVGTVTAGYSAYIVSCGSGWYRCIITFTGNAGTQFMSFGGVDADGSTTSTASGTDGVYAWQMQTIDGTFADGGPIIATAGSTASIGSPTFSVSYSNGSYTATYTFDDNSTQDIITTVSGSTFTLPTYPTLTRPRVKSVVLQVAANVRDITATQATALLDVALAGGTKGLMSGSDKAKLDGFHEAAAQADSTAANTAGIVADFNALLAKLRTAGLLIP